MNKNVDRLLLLHEYAAKANACYELARVFEVFGDIRASEICTMMGNHWTERYANWATKRQGIPDLDEEEYGC